MAGFKGANEKAAIPVWRVNNKQYDFSKINTSITSYLDGLPQDIQSQIVVTSTTGDSHAKNSRHYSGNALDIRISNKKDIEADPVWKSIAYDQSRLSKGLTVINPEHGTAPHIHLSAGRGSENKMDILYGKTPTVPPITPSITPSVTPSVTPSIPEVDNSAFLADYKAQMVVIFAY